MGLVDPREGQIGTFILSRGWCPWRPRGGQSQNSYVPSHTAGSGSLARRGTPSSSHTNEGLPDFYPYVAVMRASQGALAAKNPLANAGNIKNSGLIPGLRRFPWRRPWQRTPVFLPRESHGQRNLAGYSPWGRKESDTTEAT